jgi:rhamnosyltransferase
MLKRTVNSCLEQKAAWSFEIVIIDSGSTDGSIEWLSQLSEQHENLVVKQIPKSEFGHGKTRNLGAAVASGENLAFITQDAMPANRHWLQTLVEDLLSDNDSAGVFGRHIAYKSSGYLIRTMLDEHFAGFGKERTSFKMENEEEYKNNVSLRQFLHFYSDNNSCMRRSVWEKIPYPDVPFAEDQLWAKAIIEAGYSKVYSPNAVVYHSHNFSIIENFKRSREESYYFYKLFGYKLTENINSVFSYTLIQSIKDFKQLKHHYGMSLSLIKHFIRVPFLNFTRILGHYQGAKN